MVDRQRAHCVSLRHRVTPPHQLLTPPDVVVVVVVDVYVGMSSVAAVKAGSTSSPVSAMTVVVKVSTITTRNDIHEASANLPQGGTASARCLHAGDDMATATLSNHKTGVRYVHAAA